MVRSLGLSQGRPLDGGGTKNTGTRHAGIAKTLAAFGLALVATGCANPQVERAQVAQQTLVGMPAAQLVSCAGVPVRSRIDGPMEFMTFRTDHVDSLVTFGASAATGGRVGLGGGFTVPLGAETRTSSCEATVTLRDGVVQQVAYNTARGTGAGRLAQCGPIFQTCLESMRPASR
jgi:hypothetical protein